MKTRSWLVVLLALGVVGLLWISGRSPSAAGEVLGPLGAIGVYAFIALVILAMAIGPVRTVLSGKPRSSSIPDRLRALDRLRQGGQVTTEEYEAKRKEILASL